ncbi:hypothetical protein Taro_051124 [Colocasia esculenta]|uniref:Trichome birefringence-like N-terminal domain-containing protein n=1 Tax=Colocasia esculenta TaxID=4460 RepID=A0A843XFY6_COLES|nr:hypothetical protein [Colocasia esculenta]
MKGGDFYSVKGKQISLTLIAVFCTVLLILAWEKTPFAATFLLQKEKYGIVPRDYVKNTSYDLKFASQEVDTSHSGQLGQQYGQRDKAFGAPQKGLSVMNVTERMKNNEYMKMIPGKKSACDYAKGRWVADDKRPLYSGFGCKQWLSRMWSCRLTQRPDFSFENFRWQPDACEMPEFEGMQDKTIALVGDSLGRTQFQSLMCMVTGGKERPEVLDVGIEYGLVKAPGALRPDGWAYRFPETNTTILYYWSASLCELEPLSISDPSTSYAMHLDRPATFLRHYLHRFDVLVLNTGHHWNRGKFEGNRWKMYAGGMPVHDEKLADIAKAKNFTIHSIVRWLDSQLPNHPQLKAFFRTISPRHFINGDWNTGGSCDNTIPLFHGNQVSQNSSSDTVAESAVRGTGVKLLDITSLSQLRDEGHISKYGTKGINLMQDCLHWCLPGIPDAWNEILFAQL